MSFTHAGVSGSKIERHTVLNSKFMAKATIKAIIPTIKADTKNMDANAFLREESHVIFAR